MIINLDNRIFHEHIRNMITYKPITIYDFPLSKIGERILHEFVFTDLCFDSIDEAASKRWSAKEKGGENPTHYDSGIINTPDDPHKAERHGLVAEIAYGLYVNELNQAIARSGYRKGGDSGWDLEVNGEKIDVKCTSMKNQFWITVEDKGRIHEIVADSFVVAKMIKDSVKSKTIRIRLIGKINKDKVEDKRIEEGAGDRENGDTTHLVKKIRFNETEPLPLRLPEEMSNGIDQIL